MLDIDIISRFFKDLSGEEALSGWMDLLRLCRAEVEGMMKSGAQQQNMNGLCYAAAALANYRYQLKTAAGGVSTFTFCRLSDLFEAFVYRHGITNGIYKNPYYAPFDVHKGYSEFEALERFCRLTDLGRPYVDETKTLQVHELSGKEQAVFSPQGWTPLSAQRVLNRHKPLDEVVLMQRDTLQYSQTIANKSGLAGNISRRRYKKLFAYTDWQAQNEARRILAESRGGSREYTVTLAGLQRIAIGTGASVAAFGIAAAGLTVVKTALICSEDGIYTTVTLWPREDVY